MYWGLVVVKHLGVALEEPEVLGAADKDKELRLKHSLVREVNAKPPGDEDSNFGELNCILGLVK